jgi:prolipoprotein diacylglyceryltransferase
VLTLVFGAVYGATRVLEDFLRVDKRVFGLTGSQWTGLTVSIVCIVTLIAWAVGARRSPPDDRATIGEGGAADRTVP